MKIRFRLATKNDVGIYVHIAKRVESPINLAITDTAEALAEFHRVTVFIIVHEDQDVGFISHKDKRDDNPNPHAYISELAVDPDFQGRGIGGNALEMLLSMLDDEGFSTIDLVTHPDNPAKRLYERHGFKVEGRIENFMDSGTPRLKLVRYKPSV